MHSSFNSGSGRLENACQMMFLTRETPISQHDLAICACYRPSQWLFDSIFTVLWKNVNFIETCKCREFSMSFSDSKSQNPGIWISDHIINGQSGGGSNFLPYEALCEKVGLLGRFNGVQHLNPANLLQNKN